MTPARSIRHRLLSARRWLLRHAWMALALVLAGIALNVFLELVDELREGELTAYDTAIQAFIASVHAPLLTTLARAISDLLAFPYVFLLLAPMLVYLWVTRRNLTAALLVVIPSLTMVLVDLLKILIGRQRPMTALIPEIGRSFPSGHATGAIVIYGLLAYIGWRYLARARWARALIVVAAALLTLLTGLARVYLHVHYPSDVLGGWAAGSIILLGAIILLEAVRRREADGMTDTDPGENSGEFHP